MNWIVLDPGLSYAKSTVLNRENSIAVYIFPSTVVPITEAGQVFESETVSLEGQKFLVGKELFEDYGQGFSLLKEKKEKILPLIAYTLKRSPFKDLKSFSVMLCLPGSIEKFANEIKEMLVNKELEINSLKRQIKDVKVTSEGIAAYFHYVLKESSEGLVLDKEFFESSIAVVDIGSRTTDVVVIREGVSELTDRAVFELGVEELIRRIFHGLEVGIPSAYGALRKALQQNKMEFVVSGRRFVFGELVSQEAQRFAEELFRVVFTFGREKNVEKYYFVGGGLTLLKPYLEAILNREDVYGVDLSGTIEANLLGMVKFLKWKKWI